MLGVLLNIIGLVCIIVSFVYINKSSKEEKDMYEEMIIIHNNVKDYWIAIENTLDSFDDLIEISLNKVDTLQKETLNGIELKESGKEPLNNVQNQQQLKKNVLENSNEIKNPTKELYYKVIELKNIGLSNEEIAKKLNKGVREVETIIKMWDNI